MTSNEFQPIVIERERHGNIKVDAVSGEREGGESKPPKVMLALNGVAEFFTLAEALATADALRAAALHLDPALAPPVRDASLYVMHLPDGWSKCMGIPDPGRVWENDIERRLAVTETTLASIMSADERLANQAKPQLSRQDIEQRLMAIEAMLNDHGTRLFNVESRREYFIGLDEGKDGDQSILTIWIRDDDKSTLLATIPLPPQKPAASGEPEREAVLPLPFRVYEGTEGRWKELYFFDGQRWLVAAPGITDPPIWGVHADLTDGTFPDWRRSMHPDHHYWIVPPDTRAGDRVITPETPLPDEWEIIDWTRSGNGCGFSARKTRNYVPMGDLARATLAIESATTKGEAHILFCHWILNRAGAEAAR